MLALGQSKHQAKFLSTLSLRRATSFDFCIICLPSYFYPRSPCGERQLCEGNRAAEPYFYPRSPCGERLQSLTYGRCVLHFYPRSPCGERLCWFEELDQFDGISIHALLAESDRVPCVQLPFLSIFLSTLSLRRATAEYSRISLECPNFYPRSPCGERHKVTTTTPNSYDISIHALLAESDFMFLGQLSMSSPFLSTLSLRRATKMRESTAHAAAQFLSTLSLRRATAGQCAGVPGADHFYPRSPCGERRYLRPRAGGSMWYFYPRSPCGERRRPGGPWNKRPRFLSTLSLRRATRTPFWLRRSACYFYPRSPCGERPPCPRCSRGTLPISIHALLAESDGKHRAKWFVAKISIHALLAESD